MLTLLKLQGLEWKQHAYRIPFLKLELNICNETGPSSPDVLFTFGFTFRKPTDKTAKYNLRQLFSTYYENSKSYIFIKSYMILRTM